MSWIDAAIVVACFGIAFIVTLEYRRRTWRRIATHLYDRYAAGWANTPRWEVRESDGEPRVPRWLDGRAAAIARELQGLGFTYVGALEKGAGVEGVQGRSVVGIFIGDDGTIWAASHHTSSGIVELETELDDGCIVSTARGVIVASATAPPGDDVRLAAEDAPIAELIADHRSRVRARLDGDAARRVRACHSLQDVLASQSRQQDRELTHRRAMGYVTDVELEREAQALGLSPQAAKGVSREYRRRARQG
jgi:hypothetical protein